MHNLYTFYHKLHLTIASATSTAQLETLFAVANLKLDSEDLQLLDESRKS